MVDFSPVRHISWGIVMCTVAIIVVSLFLIYSGSQGLGEDVGVRYVERQVMWGGIGIMIAALLALIDYRKLASSAFLIYFAFLILLVIVLVVSDLRRGAGRWLSVGGFTIQPSEFAKIALILALAKYLSREDMPRNSPAYMVGALLIAAIPMALILKQPDLGTALALVPVVFAMLIVARASWAHLLYIFIVVTLSLPLGWSFLKPYQQTRIKVFLDPQLDPLRAGYNAIQSLIAVGSGGIWGRGWLQGTQTQLRFLPERHTDFIFCVLAEETGFAGCIVLIALYATVIFIGLRIAEQARDEFGRLTALGITVLLTSHVVINIGMTIGLLPITGLPLPLMSYGGSSLVSMCICLGILESICARRYVF